VPLHPIDDAIGHGFFRNRHIPHNVKRAPVRRPFDCPRSVHLIFPPLCSSACA
jgi:hypothetical protein